MENVFITKPAEPKRCRRCKAPVLRGLSEGVPVVVDRESLGDVDGPGATADEFYAMLSGVRTFVLTSGDMLYERDPSRVRHGTLVGSIHAEHDCAEPECGSVAA